MGLLLCTNMQYSCLMTCVLLQHEENPIHLAAKYDHPHLIPVLAAAKVDLDVKAKVNVCVT